MKRAASVPLQPSLASALDKARQMMQGLQQSQQQQRPASRTPSMQVPGENLGVNASDGAVELPGIVDRNSDRGFYPAQDGYARDPTTNAERELARKSQYGTDWQAQQRTQQLLLDKDPNYRLIKSIAGATQRPIDRFVQGANEEVVAIQHQRAIERARREIAIYGPDFEALEKRVQRLEETKTENAEKRNRLNTQRSRVNIFMQGEYTGVDYQYGGATNARTNGNWWVLPADIRSIQPPQYLQISEDLEKLFASDSPQTIEVYDYKIVPRADLVGFEREANATPVKRTITVFPYMQAVYTLGLLKTIGMYLTGAKLDEMSVRQLLMICFLLMNGGSFSESAYDSFEAQFSACDENDIRDIHDVADRKKRVLWIAITNWYQRLMFANGDLNAAIAATLNLNLTEEIARESPSYNLLGDESMFYGISGTDSVPTYRVQRPTRDDITGDRQQLLISLGRIRPKQPDGNEDTGPISLVELCRRSADDVPDATVSSDITSHMNDIRETLNNVIRSFEGNHSSRMFQALLYFAGYFIGLTGTQPLNASPVISELRSIGNVTLWDQADAPTVRSVVELYTEPTSPFVAIDNNGRQVELANTEIITSDLVHLGVFTSSLRNTTVGLITDIQDESTSITRAIQVAQQRLVDMTRENYDTIRRHADKLILEGELDVSPSLYSMGNSIDYATAPQNIGLIVLTPLAHYGIWATYEILQDPIPGNGLVGLPFDEIVRDDQLSIRFAKLVAAVLASTGLATGAGYQAQVRSNRIPYELQSAATAIFAFTYAVVHRDPVTGERLDPPRYKIIRQSGFGQGATYLVY